MEQLPGPYCKYPEECELLHLGKRQQHEQVYYILHFKKIYTTIFIYALLQIKYVKIL